MKKKSNENDYFLIELASERSYRQSDSIICISCIIFYHVEMDNAACYRFLYDVIIEKYLNKKQYKTLLRLKSRTKKLELYIKQMLITDYEFNILVVNRLKSMGQTTDITIHDIYLKSIKSLEEKTDIAGHNIYIGGGLKSISHEQ